jgi:hypothetical protein
MCRERRLPSYSPMPRSKGSHPAESATRRRFRSLMRSLPAYPDRSAERRPFPAPEGSSTPGLPAHPLMAASRAAAPMPASRVTGSTHQNSLGQATAASTPAAIQTSRRDCRGGTFRSNPNNRPTSVPGAEPRDSEKPGQPKGRSRALPTQPGSGDSAAPRPRCRGQARPPGRPERGRLYAALANLYVCAYRLSARGYPGKG